MAVMMQQCYFHFTFLFVYGANIFILFLKQKIFYTYFVKCDKIIAF